MLFIFFWLILNWCRFVLISVGLMFLLVICCRVDSISFCICVVLLLFSFLRFIVKVVLWKLLW